MAQHRVVNDEVMFCPGTDIDSIDKRWPQTLAYFSWVHLEKHHTAHWANR